MQTALITGVSGGIGKAIAKKFIDEGYFVIGQYNNNEKSVLDFTAELEITRHLIISQLDGNNQLFPKIIDSILTIIL